MIDCGDQFTEEGDKLKVVVKEDTVPAKKITGEKDETEILRTSNCVKILAEAEI